ncbi:MAG: TatD family hydrolase [Pasteurellaceae bacterium]|nr:TatD family hydrolase [Pasteurellaceae bacterium]
MFDTHIHLDQFTDSQIAEILENHNLQGVVAVATDLASSQRLLKLKSQFPKIHCCAGFHPEQPLPSQTEIDRLFAFLEKNRSQLIACGEVGLPHYLKRENPTLDYQPYIALLERFIQFCKGADLPINLHIVYDDALIALELLAKYQVRKAHFHWFKASADVVQKVLETDYVVSLTPDILWNEKTQYIARTFPLERLLIETDAPWQHDGFATHDIAGQLVAVIEKIAEIKGISAPIVSRQLERSSRSFYRIE